MADQKTLDVKVLNQQGVLFDGTCHILFVPGQKEEFAILPEHTPLILLLKEGVVSVVIDGDKKVISQINHGLTYVGQNQATVLVNN